MKYVCELCGRIYDEDQGEPRRGIPAGTAFAMLPDDYFCSSCGSEREAFVQIRPVRQRQRREAAGFWTRAKYQDDNHISDR